MSQEEDFQLAPTADDLKNLAAIKLSEEGTRRESVKASMYLLSNLYEPWGPPEKTWRPVGQPSKRQCKYGHDTSQPGSRHARYECAKCQSNRALFGHPLGSAYWDDADTDET